MPCVRKQEARKQVTHVLALSHSCWQHHFSKNSQCAEVKGNFVFSNPYCSWYTPVCFKIFSSFFLFAFVRGI